MKQTQTTMAKRSSGFKIFLSLCLFLGTQFASIQNLATIQQASAQDAEPVALVRIDLSKAESDVQDRRFDPLVGLNLILYETVYTPEGEPFLIAAADSATQAQAASLGFRVSVLDPNIQGNSYWLLYGAPEDLERASAITRILLVEGRIGLAAISDPQGTQNGNLGRPTTQTTLAGLTDLGLKIAPLAPRPLTAQSSPQKQQASLPQAITPHPQVEAMIVEMNASDLYNLVGGLSGEWAVTVGGSPYTLLTRYTYSGQPVKKATRYAYEFFQSQGLIAWYDDYTLAGYEVRNVIAQQTGLTHPERIYLLTAHLDSTSHVNGDPYNFAPGADDNASGSAALMRIAEIFSQYHFGCTLRYALFTGEEQGLYGSKAYAAEIHSTGEDLRGVLNLDMLGYSTSGSPSVIELHTRPGNANDLAIANLFRDAISAYNIQLSPSILQDGESFSDHSSFWTYNYPAILAIEDWNDHTPFYHRTGDQLETLNMPYYTQFAKAALATFAHMGCLLDGELAGVIQDSATSTPIEGAVIEAWQESQLKADTTSQADGSYQLLLPPGNYTINISAQDHLGASYPNTTITYGQTTSLNASLTACIFVNQVEVTVDPGFANIGETFTFTATVGRGDPPISLSWDFGDGGSASGATVTHAYAAQGGYTVELTANNSCGVPQTVLAPAFVEVELLFLPLVKN